MLKPLLLSAALTMLAAAASAQTYTLAPALNPTDPTQWGLSAEVAVTSPTFQKRSLAPVTFQVKVRFYKKVAQACAYEYQVTNTSSSQAVSVKIFALNDQKSTEIIGPGQSVLLPVRTHLGGSKKVGDTPCVEYSPKLTITEARPR